MGDSFRPAKPNLEELTSITVELQQISPRNENPYVDTRVVVKKLNSLRTSHAVNNISIDPEPKP